MKVKSDQVEQVSQSVSRNATFLDDKDKQMNFLYLSVLKS